MEQENLQSPVPISIPKHKCALRWNGALSWGGLPLSGVVSIEDTMSHRYSALGTVIQNADARLENAELYALSVPSVANKSFLMATGRGTNVMGIGRPNRELAENAFNRLLTPDRAVAENWMAVAKIVGVNLWCTFLLVAGAFFLALAALLLR